MRRVSRADLMLLVTVLLWGFNVTVTKYVLEHGFRLLAYSAVRYGGAALLFCGVTYGLERTLRVRRRDLPLLLLAAGLGVWLNQLSFMYAVKLTTATTVGLVLGTIPIFTALIARALGVERLSGRFWAASAVSFGGVARDARLEPAAVRRRDLRARDPLGADHGAPDPGRGRNRRRHRLEPRGAPS